MMIVALTCAGSARSDMSDYNGSTVALEEAEQILGEREEDPRLLADVRSFQARIHRDRGHFRRALRLTDEALALYARAGDPRGEVKAKLRRALAYADMGDASAALTTNTQALQLCKRLDDHELRLVVFQNLIVSAVAAGDMETATEWLDNARPIFTAAAPPHLYQYFQWIEARYDCAHDSLPKGVNLLEELSEKFRAQKLRSELSTICLDLALIYRTLGFRSKVQRILSEVVDISTSLGMEHERRKALALLKN